MYGMMYDMVYGMKIHLVNPVGLVGPSRCGRPGRCGRCGKEISFPKLRVRIFKNWGQA